MPSGQRLVVRWSATSPVRRGLSRSDLIVQAYSNSPPVARTRGSGGAGLLDGNSERGNALQVAVFAARLWKKRVGESVR